jgi:drug/metabolite transporter (DMT)-like permease
LKAAHVPFLTGAIAFGGIAAPVLLMFGLQRTPASGAALLVNLEAVFTVVIAWAVFRENIDFHIAAALVAIITGGVVLSWTGSFFNWRNTPGRSPLQPHACVGASTTISRNGSPPPILCASEV